MFDYKPWKSGGRRTLYETVLDQAHQEYLARELIGVLGSGFHFTDLGSGSPIDYILMLGAITVGYAEMKWRYNSLHKYRTFFISDDKHKSALEWNKKSGLPVWLVLHFTDGIYYVRFDTVEIVKKEEKSGRTKQTRDKYDIETVVHIAPESMKPLKCMLEEEYP